jgi:hypothetical protein
MAEDVECLPGTCEVPSSNPINTKKKKKKCFKNLKEVILKQRLLGYTLSKS